MFRFPMLQLWFDILDVYDCTRSCCSKLCHEPYQRKPSQLQKDITRWRTAIDVLSLQSMSATRKFNPEFSLSVYGSLTKVHN